MKRFALISPMFLALSGCGAGKPVDVMAGEYEITQLSGRGELGTFKECVRAEDAAEWPANPTKELISITNTRVYGKGCSETAKTRDVNTIAVTHYCKDLSTVKLVDFEYRFQIEVGKDALEIERTLEGRAPASFSKEEADEVNRMLAKDPRWGTDTFSAVRKGDC